MRNAVITGAASGLGRALAIALARRGDRIIIADISMDGVQETLEMVHKAGGEGEVFQCDVSRKEDVQKMADYCFTKWKRVDLLINNAGVVSCGFTGDVPLQDWEWITGINLWGVIYGCHYFIPRMKTQGKGGHIVNIASAAGLICLPEMGPYNVVKAGVISLSETIKPELAPYDIGVTVVCPTFFHTGLHKTLRNVDPFQKEFSNAAFENGRLTAEKIAEMILKAVDKNKLYLVPQMSGRFAWRVKRLSPGIFYRNIAFMMRRKIGEKFLLYMARKGLT